MYIREIERANDQLKQNAAALFQQKGISREQQELFLKKVNFTENREYFFQKRKAMANHDFGDMADSQPATQPPPTEVEVRPEAPADRTEQRNFFDDISSSCRYDRGPARRSREAYEGPSQKQVRFHDNRRGGHSHGQYNRPAQKGGDRADGHRRSKEARPSHQAQPEAKVWRPRG